MHTYRTDPAATEQQADQLNIVDCLSQLPAAEHDAVARVFGLTWLLDNNSLTAAELCRQFGTEDLEGYVHNVVIAKLRLTHAA